MLDDWGGNELRQELPIATILFVDREKSNKEKAQNQNSQAYGIRTRHRHFLESLDIPKKQLILLNMNEFFDGNSLKLFG